MHEAKAHVSRDADPILPPSVREHLGAMLRASYGDCGGGPVPDRVRDFLSRLESALAAQGESLGDDMRRGLGDAAPALRAYAISLTRNAARADDLVQETMLKAWTHRDRFEPGSNLGAWLATILRNLHVSDIRKHRREVEDVDGEFAGALSMPPPQSDRDTVRDLESAMRRLTPEQRDAIILVTVRDVPYNEAAAMLGCAVGTLKTRVCRARDRLAEMLGHETRTPVMVRPPRAAMHGIV
jgi:RNA polymerase sigma factor (sigma-70 family)